MAFISISGEPGCRQEALAQITAQRLGFELVTESQVCEMVGA
jgi:cytidylate kinase